MKELDRNITDVIKDVTPKERITNALLLNASFIDNIGLMHGKMGVAIFLYHLFNKSRDKQHEEIADNLIDELFTTLGKNASPPDFENGLAGIGWGIEYLVQNGFVEADTDEILEDIDNKIFQYIIFNEELPFSINNGLLGYAAYVIWRMKSSSIPDVKYTLQRLLIEIINRIGLAIDKQKVKVVDPPVFTVLWELPLLLTILGETLDLDIYNSKIFRILEELSPTVNSLIPQLHGNRAYLLLGVKAVSKFNVPEQWKAHAELLSKNICADTILNEEFTNKNILISSGLGGVLFVFERLTKLYPEKNISLTTDLWITKLEESAYWDELSKNEKLISNRLGLLNGLAGLGCLLLFVEQNKNFSL